MFCMDAAEKIRRNKRDYGNMLLAMRRAESLQRAVRRGATREIIAKKTESFKQAIAKAAPVVVQFIGSGVQLGRRV